jgi:hypothetical protein
MIVHMKQALAREHRRGRVPFIATLFSQRSRADPAALCLWRLR